MLLLIDEVKKRTQFLHNYLDQLSTSINHKKYHQALHFISNQKSNINHTNVSKYNPHTFLIDSLKTKYQKLNHHLLNITKQKNQLQSQLNIINKNCGGVNNPLNIDKIPTIISKIPISIKDIKKLQLQPMSLQTNYQSLTITTSQSKIYYISISNIFYTDKKSFFLNINTHYQSQQNNHQLNNNQLNNDTLYIIFKFNQQHILNKWLNAFTFGKILSEAKANRYLFIQKNNIDDIQPLIGSKDTYDKKAVTQESQVIFFGNNNNINNNNISPFKSTFIPQNSQKFKYPMYNSVINQKPSSIPDNPFYQPHRHLTSSQINDPNKKPTNYSAYRPTPLNRVRGKSMYLEFNPTKNGNQYKNKDEDYMNQQNNFFQQKSQHKSSSKNNFRKASQDITLRPKNTSHQEKKLQKFRSQRNLMDQLLSQSNNKNKQSNSINQGNSKRIDAQIQKKNQLIQRSNRNLDRALTTSFRPQDNFRWVKQNDESMSKSSHHTNKKSNSRFKQQIQYTLDDPSKQAKFNSTQSQIQQASQIRQMSPTFPKKIVYEDGSNIRLYPVENTQTRPKANSKTTSQYQSQQNQDVEPLHDMQQNEAEQSRRVRNQRLNTLDSQTEKQHQIHESNSQDHQQQEFQQLLDELKKGLVLTKCAQGSFWTRQKQIKLSQNQNTLLVIDVKDKKIKKTPISDIISVEYGKFSKGIIKHIQQIQEKKCLMLSVQQGKQVKKIQFIGNNPQKLLIFANNLNYYVETFKSS